MSEAILSFDQVGLAYRRTINPFSEKSWVLKDISFDLYPGEVLGVIGKNGAGKSTLLRLLADIVAPNKGRITRKPGLHIQLLSLALGFNQQLDGYDNAIMASVMLGKTIKQAKALVDEIAAFAEIEHLMEHPVHTYSSGERARLGFSIAMQASPDVLLLDEILSVGDRDFQQKSATALREWISSEQTAVLVSHQPMILQKFCKRVVWIEQGCVKMVGEAEAVMQAYNSAQTQAAQAQ